MKKLRVTYNYHSPLLDTYRHMEITLAAGEDEAEDVFQEFEKRSNRPIQDELNFPMLKLISMICTGQIFLAGDIVDKRERENIYCITDIEEVER